MHMSLEQLTEFFKWATIIGLSFYVFTALMIILAKDFIVRMHSKMFHLEKQTLILVLYSFLGGFKILLLLFILVPYLALLML